MVQKESPIPSSSDKSHVIRTSAQWDSSGDQYHVIPRGVLCVELTANGKTKIKVGEGNKFYSQLPYICDMGDLSNYYTKEEVDLIVENLEFMSIKSTEEYDSRNQLPKIGNKLGDVRFVKNPNNQYDDPLLYVWNGSKWVFSGGSIIDIDLSEYCKKSEILPRLQQLEALSHTHRNKDILDSTSAIYTTEKDEKLASLKNYDVFVPATEEDDGVDGLVPAPSASETDKFLRGDGTWVDVESEKYSAGEGITILSGETIVDGGEAQLFPKTSFLEDYAVYGNEGGVGDYDSALGKYSIPIRTYLDDEESTYETKVLLDNPIESGDYIIYSKQLFVHSRTLMHWSTTYSFAYLDANGVLQTHGGSWVDWTPAVTDFIEIEPGKVYETEKSDYEYYVNQASMNHYRCYHAYYDENQVCTRTVPTSITGRLTFTPVEGEKYLRIAVNRSGTEKRLWLLERTEEPVSLDPVRVFPNKTNTINVETTIQPSEIYLKAGVDESEPVDPDDPTSKFTGIIHNDGVLDITQDDPDNLNVLTIHFRDDESKDITINTGVSECVVDIIQADPDNPNALTIKYADGTSTVITIPGGNYHPGDGISFETEQWSVSEQFIGHESEWTNWTFYGPTSEGGTGWDTMVTNAENRSTRCHEIINRTLKIEAWDVNNRALWTVVFLYDQNGTHYTSTNWQKTGTGIVHIIPDSAAYFGIGLARLPDTDTQYSDGRRERMTPSEVKSVKVMWLVEDSGDENEIYIHNEGVLDITQDNPDALNELTVHFRESSKGITIPSDAYVLPPATDTTLGGVIVGDGLEITEEGVLSGNEYHAGTAISMSGEAILPVEYQQIEYLESTGTQYINPEIIMWSDNRNKCEITFAYTELGNDTWATGIFNGYYGYVAGVAPIDGAWYTASGTTYDPNIFETNTVITAQFNYDNSYQSLLLFCRGASNVGPASFSKSRIYHVKMTRDADILGDLYPCIRKSDNVPGMYDIARNRFFTNAGTGDFICGNVIRTDGNIINVNIGQGLSVDNDNNIVNEGVLEVSEKQSAPGVFTVSKRDADTDIDLFDSLGKITINCNMNPD